MSPCPFEAARVAGRLSLSPPLGCDGLELLFLFFPVLLNAWLTSLFPLVKGVGKTGDSASSACSTSDPLRLFDARVLVFPACDLVLRFEGFSPLALMGAGFLAAVFLGAGFLGAIF